MKRIGLIGGMSWKSTAEYYRLLNELVQERLGGLHSSDCLIASVDFATVQRMQVEGRWDDAGEVLAQAARSLEAGGAELIALCTNTMHIVAGAITAAIDVPFLDLIDLTAQTVRDAGCSKIGLLGTAHTMDGTLYADQLARRGVGLVVPEPDDRQLVHRVIFDELCQGVVSDASRAAYRDVIARLVADGACGVILGCTEIELLVGPDDSAVPLYPTTRLHVSALIDAALA